MPYFHCPECGLTLAPRGAETEIEHCPRCIARWRKLIRMSPAAAGKLEVRACEQHGSHTLELTGELDIASAPLLEARIAEACDSGARQIVIDLTGLEFLDSRGLLAILVGKKRCDARGCEFVITRASEPIERLFELTRLAQRLSAGAPTSRRRPSPPARTGARERPGSGHPG